MIPVLDLSRRTAAHREAFLAAADRVLLSGHVLLGSELAGLESEFARWTGHAHAVAVSSGASALQLGLQAMGIGPGDEVLVPAFTAVPTASAVLATGAIPVPVDVDPLTVTMDGDAAKAALSERTRAAVPVHLYGYPAELPDVGVAVLEDGAQAHGALQPGASAATAYSFYPTKNLGGIGDGGAVVTDDESLAATVRRLRAHGMTEQYVHTDVSQNFRMSELEAVWLRLLLPQVERDNARRREIAARYREAAPSLEWPAWHDRHAMHLCVVGVDDRDEFRRCMATHGIGTAVHYPLALTQQPAYRHLRRDPCPVAERWAGRCVSLPCFPELRDDEVEAVCGALAAVRA